jgi:hypothetical protein
LSVWDAAAAEVLVLAEALPVVEMPVVEAPELGRMALSSDCK